MLDLLGSTNDDGFAFRRHIISAHTTWKCNENEGEEGYVYSSTGERDKACEPDSEFFVVWNADANFTWDARDKKFDPR